MSQKVAPLLKGDEIIVIVSKGLEIRGDDVLTTSQVVERALKSHGKENQIVSVGGPALAKEVSRRALTMSVYSCKDVNVAKKLKEELKTDVYRIVV